MQKLFLEKYITEAGEAEKDQNLLFTKKRIHSNGLKEKHSISKSENKNLNYKK